MSFVRLASSEKLVRAFRGTARINIDRSQVHLLISPHICSAFPPAFAAHSLFHKRMVDRDDPLQNEASSSASAAYTGRFGLDMPGDDSDDIPPPPSYVPSTVARKLMKGSKKGKSSSSMSSQTPNPAPQPTYRIIRGPPSPGGPTASRRNAPSHMPSRSISVPYDSEPPSSSVTRVPSPDWDAPTSHSAPSGSSRIPPGGTRGNPSPRRRGQSSKLRNVITAPIPPSPIYETEAEFPPSSPYVPHPASSPAPYAFPSRSTHPSVITPLRHASLPPSTSHPSVHPVTRHPSLPPSSPPGEFSSFSRHPSIQPSTPPPSYPPRTPHPSLYQSTPYAARPSPSGSYSSLPPPSQHPSLMPRPPPQPPQPSATPPPLPASSPPSAPPIASSSSASTSASTSANTARSTSRFPATATASSRSGDGGSDKPPTEATIRCRWETCTSAITGVQNFGKHLKKEHSCPVVQHGRQSGPTVQCKWVRCGIDIASLELYVHILQVHLKFGYHCRHMQKDGRTRCEYRPVRLDTLERHTRAVHPGEKKDWDETTLLPP
ncbi:hypothetical protein CVT25_013465 [Psilocybe cyanescens]|uniref:C2H2-type domain-containing protein n=1 Tax=Psilocybe cyanescens TaxID=93625 RepID=A0A409WTK9_PSICY|nr:hypothetical protein CVT25_013465 [Psilocybe cyanescens]